MKNQRRQVDDDDGRVICSMSSVDGTAWQQKEIGPEGGYMETPRRGDPLTPSEARRFTFQAVLASLLIVSVFSVGWILFILFCTQIWFK
jgi:hypothetical protein